MTDRFELPDTGIHYVAQRGTALHAALGAALYWRTRAGFSRRTRWRIGAVSFFAGMIFGFVFARYTVRGTLAEPRAESRDFSTVMHAPAAHASTESK
jgi:hypothetical protein